MSVNNSLLKSMQTIVDKSIEIAPFDKTRQAQVVANNADGTYAVRLDGVLYGNVISYPRSASITEGSVVKIVMPSNQPSQMYIVTPKGGGGGDHLEITQEDYDNLPTDKKQGDTVFFVTESEPEYLIMSDSVPIGAIQSYGGNVAPSGWLICDGRAISRTEYSELFYVIGTTYGSGDGSTTFNVPDLKGRVITGVGTCDGVTYALGDKKSAGVPNITGTLRTGWGDATGGGIILNKCSGAINNLYRDGTAYWARGDVYGDTYHNNSFGFNAQASDSHYGASPTVQPNTTVANYIIKAKQPPTENVIKGLDPQGVLFDAFYPVGSYYETSDISFDPNISWGGTWTKLPTDFSESKKLLWTNPSPTATFGAQDIALDFSNYNVAEVSFFIWTGLNYVVCTDRGEVNGAGVMSFGTASSIAAWNNGYVDMIARSWNVNSSRIHFDGAAEGNPAAQSATTNPVWLAGNHTMIPYKIYGIKQTTSYSWHRTA